MFTTWKRLFKLPNAARLNIRFDIAGLRQELEVYNSLDDGFREHCKD